MNVVERRAHCGYTTEATQNSCDSCGAFVAVRALMPWMSKHNAGGEGLYINNSRKFTVEEHGVLRGTQCGDHRFSVKKTASCRLWRPVDSDGHTRKMQTTEIKLSLD